MFITCDDPNNPFANPFTNNLGKKVVVERPTIIIERPTTGAYLPGDSDRPDPVGRPFVVNIQGTATAEDSVRKVEWKVFANDIYKQRETEWTDRGIRLEGGQKLKNVILEFNTKEFNGGKDGFVEIQFRVFSTRTIDSYPNNGEYSVKNTYIIKNNPSEIKMANPPESDIIDPDPDDDKVPKINYGGEIKGNVIDLRGLKPGFPQIKIWKDGDPEPDDDDPALGYVSMYLPGIGNSAVGFDNILEGSYADRTKMRVVNAAPFSFKLAKYTVGTIDPAYPDVRPIEYVRPDPVNLSDPTNFENYGAGDRYNFRIRTRDVEPGNGGIPKPDPVPLPDPLPWIEGIFPYYDLGGPYEDPLYRTQLAPGSDDIIVGRLEPIKITIFSSNSRPTIEINNDDILSFNGESIPPGTANKVLSENKNKPNIYITSGTEKKIAIGDSSKPDFRLRLKIIQPNGFKEVKLSWKHDNRFGTLKTWDATQDDGLVDPGDTTGRVLGKYFEFTAMGNVTPNTLAQPDPETTHPWNNAPIFITSPNAYELTVTVTATDGSAEEARYYVTMDGVNPYVSVRSVRGAAADPGKGADEFKNGTVAIGLINNEAYTVNGNIQVAIDRTDDSGIMAFKDGMGFAPTGNDGSYPMVKWIVEPAGASDSAPSTTGTVLKKLIDYKNDPSPGNLVFFNNIQDGNEQGWIKRPISTSATAPNEDRAHHLKFNTTSWISSHGDKSYLWLYVIAMDQVQNLGFVVQKIYVDKDSDIPEIVTSLFERNASDQTVGGENGIPIAGPSQLDITVDVPDNRKLTGNISASTPRRNILESRQPIELNFRDDDGINLDPAKGDIGIKIFLTDLNVNLNGSPPGNTVEIIVRQGKGEVITTGNKRDMSGMLTQEIMAKALDVRDEKGNLKTTLNDGMYKIEFRVVDDINEKVKIEPSLNTGDTPTTASKNITYWFAVFTEFPDLKITFPDNNALGGSVPMAIFGTVRSRFLIRSVWITFAPDVITPDTSKTKLEELTPLYSDPAFTITTPPTPGDDGYYTYYWRREGVTFSNAGSSTDPPRFTVEAWDRLGNMSNEVRTVQLDGGGPDVSLIDFNKGRPPDPTPDPSGNMYVYGKVSFTVSASDSNGMYDVNGSAGIKWWVLPIATADPVTWEAPFPASNGAGGEFLQKQIRGGNFTWVIDTRKLTDGQTYKLCILGRDKAGNLSGLVKEIFTVNQSKDYPVIDANSLDPYADEVKDKRPTIIGLVSDADLFSNQAERNTYVQIRFAATTNPSTGAPATWTGWIDIKLDDKYSSDRRNLGGIDPSGAIVYRFRPEDYASNTVVDDYLNSDGIKYYQIRVTDEPKEVGGSLGKNPDEFMKTEPINYPDYVDDPMPARTIIFPQEPPLSLTKPTPDPAPSGAFKFIVDASFPEIFFTKYDPNPENPPHIGYNPIGRPTYSKWEGDGGLKAALSGWVVEFKLSTLSLSWTAGKNIITKVILNNPDDPPVAGRYDWDLTKLTADEDTALKNFFDTAAQGMQIISFEATDMVSKTSRVSWLFSKDTQGPEINFNITRSIKRIKDAVSPFLPAALPDTGDFPSYPDLPLGQKDPRNWPSDWRYGTTWSSAWSSPWKSTIEYWPSEYAFLSPSGTVLQKATAVINALDLENGRLPSTIVGDGEDKIGAANYAPPVIDGSFSDQLSFIRIVEPPNTDTFFYYRFRDPKTGAIIPIPGGSALGTQEVPLLQVEDGWIQKKIEPQTSGQNERTADWKITLDKVNGFYGPDGENWLDIKVSDTAKNISEIFNVRFVVDRTAPLLGSLDTTGTLNEFKPGSGEFKVFKIDGQPSWTSKPLPEMQRVFSGTYAAGDNAMAFILEGEVSDYNLSSLKITIGQEGTTSYTVSASLDIDSTKIGSNPLTDGYDAYGVAVSQKPDQISGVNDAYVTDPGKSRLKITALRYLPDGTPVWTWQFEIRKKDAYGLRNAALGAADSARRYIRVTASDRAKKTASPPDWNFYLDTKKPTLDYTNLEKGGEKYCSSFENNTLSLSGLVSDDTRIQDVRFMIGRWSYTTNDWEWYNGSSSTWGATIPTEPTPGNLTTWPSAFKDETSPTRQTTMNWTINQKTLTENASAFFPANLFDNEGYYRLDLYITDFSLGSGNPHHTYNPADQTADPLTSFSDANYDTPTAGAGMRSGRVFYIDQKDPNLQWGWVQWNPTSKKWEPVPGGDGKPLDPTSTDTKTYFRNENGLVKFSFTVGDGNTIKEWEAKVEFTNLDGSKTTVLNSSSPSLKWHSGNSSSLSISPAIPVPATSGAVPLSTTAIVDQYLLITPFMTTDAAADSSADAAKALDKVGGNTEPKPYTITITVTDGAGRTNNISKQFILDNRPPEFVQDKFTPLSYKHGNDNDPAPSDPIAGPPPSKRDYSYDAVTGRLNIRGNTTDNSNQIKRIAYYVVNTDDSSNFNSFPNPTDLDPAKWHWYDQSIAGGSYEIKVGSTTLFEIDEGTFAWRIIVPRTTSFFDGETGVEKYIQKTTTNGVSDSGATITGKVYNDVTTSANPYTVPWTTDKGALGTGVTVPFLTFPGLANKIIYGNENVGMITVYLLAEDAAGNTAFDALKYWVWPEGDRPIVTAINNPDSTKIKAERMLNGSIRLSGMAKDNEQVKNVWFRVLKVTGHNADGSPITGAPYSLSIPEWDEAHDWADTGAKQDAKDLSELGSRKGSDLPVLPANSGGWYKANGGNSPQVSWWAYINTAGELDPVGVDMNEIVIQIRAQDVTWDDKTGAWKKYENGYNGLVSLPMETSAWVVSGAPKFENEKLAPVNSKDADGTPPSPPGKPPQWEEITKLNIRNRAAYKVTVKHNLGLSAIRWSPTTWTSSLNGNNGGFQADPQAEPFNLLTLKSGEYVYFTDSTNTTNGTAVKLADWTAANTALTNGTARMTATVQPVKTTTITSGRKYLIWEWNQTDGSTLMSPSGAFNKDPDLYEADGTTFKKDSSGNSILRNSILTAQRNYTGSFGNAVLLEADSTGNFSWDVIVDVDAKAMLARMLVLDPNYGKVAQFPSRAGQVEDSVYYPLYLRATEVSRATPFTTVGDALLPLDQLPPTGMYTLNRKPAGIAATIGGEAGDNGPVSGVARVVLWFERSGIPISWHEQVQAGVTSLPKGFFTTHTKGNGPVWWDNLDDGVIPETVAKPAIPQNTNPADCADGVGASAIVIDENSPSSGLNKWGHKLPMGFADGGMGKYWYVEINSFGITSGPVTLHFVVIDKAGNAHYYKERLVIMNNAAVISRIKLATDIRHDSGLRDGTTGWTGNAGGAGGRTGTLGATSPYLDKIRARFAALGTTTEVQKGITEFISSPGATSVNNIIDFNVRNNLFALRVETTAGPGAKKDRNFRLEYVSNMKLLSNTQLPTMKAGRIYIIDEPGNAKWGAIGADGEGPWPRGYAFLAVIDGTVEGEAKISGTGSVWELNTSYYNASNERTNVPTALQLADVQYDANPSAVNTDAIGAEFVYSWDAFGTGPLTGTPLTAQTILDYNGNDAYPAAGVNPIETAASRQSMFIIKVFDGPESDTFGDFTIIRIRVNNNDMTKPFAQLYDINPKTEGQDRQNIALDDLTKEKTRSVSPMFIGEGTGSNRTKGGLWNSAPTLGVVAKPGHIEPMSRTTGWGTPVMQGNINMYTAPQPGEYIARNHSLTSAQMGGSPTLSTKALTDDAATIQKPWANPAGFLTGTNARDTVSGKVVLRGYVEDDQRIQQVNLEIGNYPPISILTYDNSPANTGDNANYVAPFTGLLKIPTGQEGKVYFTDSIDLYRHRVEWAYIWDTETIPASTVVSNNPVNVRVVSYNRRATDDATKDANEPVASPGTPHTNISDATKPNTSPFNPGFPIGINKYSSIEFNLRPYITGFLRNTNDAAHNTRSRQGRYMFNRGETAVVTGFNLSGTGTSAPTITINGSNITTSDVGATANYGITESVADGRNLHYRQFTVGGSNSTGNGLVTYSLTNGTARTAINTSGERGVTTNTTVTPNTARPNYIQPWNIEYSPGVDGSELWEDFTQVHIWQSNNTAPNTGNNTATNGSGYFYTRPDAKISNPAMSINPRTGTLYESHNGSGGTSDGNDFYNTGRTIKSPITIDGYGNDTPTRAKYWVTQFSDPIFFSDVYRRPTDNDNDSLNTNTNTHETWAVSSIIGRSGDLQHWRGLGGIYISGPGGTGVSFTGGGTGSGQGNNGVSFQNSDYSASLYYGESTWYNASSNNQNQATPPSTDQFMNPHIVTSIVENVEHIHVAYYDDLTGSIKYRYNRRGNPGTVDPGNGNDTNVQRNIPRMWTNLDGNYDKEDTDSTTWIPGTQGSAGDLGANSRVVNPSGRGSTPPKVGKHNSIAVTSQGYPVIAYYDQTNQRLKLAVSSLVNPVEASRWTIIPDISSFGTGEFVSMKINTVPGSNPGQEQNRVHIAAMNTNKRLVYITFRLNGSAIAGDITEQVVDSVGNVGRWCSLSLDSEGNPWISYMDESYLGARDGVKLAYKNTTSFYKGVTGGTYFPGKYLDINGKTLEGWETMHIPTAYRVQNPVASGREHGRLGMECFPARNTTPYNNAQKFWSGAVSFLSTDLGSDRYHIAYYVK